MSLSVQKKLPMVAHYFFYFAGFAAVDLFMPTYARQLGFSSVMVGTIYTVLPITGMLGTLLMSVVADKFQIHKSLVLCCISIAVINFYCLIFVPVKNDFEITCNEVSAIRICSSDHFKSFQINNGISVNTSMECLADSEFLNTLCTYWNSSDSFCEDFKYLDTKHDSFISENKKNMEELYSLFINRFSASKLINFDVQLSSFNNIQNSDCLTLKIEKIKRANEHNWEIPYCVKLHNSSCHIYDNLSKNTGITSKISKVILNNFQFWLFMILMVIGWTSRVIVSNLADSICCKLLGDNCNEYGTIRSWGSIGWGINALLTGFLVDYYSFGKRYKDFRPMFYLIAATFSLDLLVSTSLKETRQVHGDNSIGKDVKKLFLDVRIFLFFVTCIMMGIGGSLISNFLFWYLEEIAGKNTKWIKTLEGTVACFKSLGGELPSYYFNSWLLKKIGHIHSISLVYLAYGIRYFLHSFIENPWWSIPIEILGGLTVSTLHATMVSYASLIAPLGTEATMQSIVDALYSGVGMSLGSVIGGFLMNRFHSGFVFKIYGGFAIMLCILHFVVQSYLRKNSDEHNLLLPSSDTIQDRPTCEDTDGESDKECKGNEDLNFS